MKVSVLNYGMPLAGDLVHVAALQHYMSRRSCTKQRQSSLSHKTPLKTNSAENTLVWSYTLYIDIFDQKELSRD